MILTVDNIISLAGLVLSLISLLVTAYVGVWIAGVLQKRSDASNAFREYVVNKILKIQESYEFLFLELSNSELPARKIKTRLFQYTQQLDNILRITEKHYNQKGEDLKKCARAYFAEIENFNSYIEYYDRDEMAVKFNQEEQEKLSLYEGKFENLFPNLISNIYESNESVQ